MRGSLWELPVSVCSSRVKSAAGNKFRWAILACWSWLDYLDELAIAKAINGLLIRHDVSVWLASLDNSAVAMAWQVVIPC